MKYQHMDFRTCTSLVAVGLLYICQGLPLGLAMDFLPTYLKIQGADLQLLSWLPIIGLPWIIKFLWAPFVDNHWYRKLGKRRSWILPMQASITLLLAIVAFLKINESNLALLIILFLLMSVAAATQDIATDGYLAERFDRALLPIANAVQVSSTLIGFFIGGGLALMLVSKLGTTLGLLSLSLIPLVGMFFSLLMPNKRAPVIRAQHDKTAKKTSASLLGFFVRKGATTIVLFAVISSVLAVGGFSLGKLYLASRDWNTFEIGQLAMFSGGVTIFFGCGLVALAIRRFGIRPLAVTSVSMAILGALTWLTLISGYLTLDKQSVYVAVAFGALATGGMSVCVMTMAAQFASYGKQSGTDMTAVQSARDLGEMTASSGAISIAAAIGFSNTFTIWLILGVIALFCLFIYRYEAVSVKYGTGYQGN